MKIRTSISAFLALTFTAALTAGAFEPIDTGALGEPLPLDDTVNGAYELMDVSASGRYVLLSNFDLNAPPAPLIFPDDGSAPYFPPPTGVCTLYRKDRQTGDIVTVFESDEDLTFCGSAKISANGRYVAAAPGQLLPASVCENFAADVISLTVKDVDTGNVSTATKRFELTSANDIARVCAGNGAASYPALNVYGLSGNGQVATIRSEQVSGNVVGQLFELADVKTGLTEPVAIADDDPLTISTVLGVALSRNGNRLAIQTEIFSPCLPDAPCLSAPTELEPQPTGPSNVILCGQVGRCDQIAACDESASPADCEAIDQYNKQVLKLYAGRFPASAGDCGSWWQCPTPTDRATAITIVNRKTGAVRQPAALTGLPAGARLQPNAWSRTGKRLSWVEYPEIPFNRCVVDSRIPNPVCTNVGCEANTCELKARTYFLAAHKTRTQRTDFDSETLSVCTEYEVTSPTPSPGFSGPAFVSQGVDCAPKLSSNGNKLLYARAVRFPFGDDWQPQQFGLGDYVCVTRVSLETPGFEPDVVDCPPEFEYPEDGPIIGINKWDLGTHYSNPIIWYVRNLRAKQTLAVSSQPAGQLFSSTRALLSGNGLTLAFQSSDPQLESPQPRRLAPTIVNSADSCTWSPTGIDASIPLATNDNVQVVGEAELVVYPETPVVCAVPEQALRSGVYAGDAQPPAR